MMWFLLIYLPLYRTPLTTAHQHFQTNTSTILTLIKVLYNKYALDLNILS